MRTPPRGRQGNNDRGARSASLCPQDPKGSYWEVQKEDLRGALSKP